MQFEPDTFAVYGVDAGDGDAPSPYDLRDATLAAARLLCVDGAADPATLATAIWDYNHDWAYVADVLVWAERYDPAALAVPATGEPGAPMVGHSRGAGPEGPSAP